MKKILGVLALVAVATVGAFSFAFPGEGKLWGERGGEHHEAVRTAIEANDYSLLPEKAQEKMSEEQFAEKVANHEKMEAHKTAVEEAVANDDFATFKALHEEHRADMEAKRVELASEGTWERGEGQYGGEELTDEEKELKQQEHFDKLVAYYQDNGELPEMKKKKGEGKGMGKAEGRKDGARKHFGEAHKGIVKNAIRNANPDRLTKALERISDKIGSIEANDDLDEEKKERILDLLAGIQETIEEILAE